MVSFGSKALPLRRLGGIMGDEDNSHKRSRKKMGMSRKPDKQSNSFDANVNKNGSGRGSQRQSDSETQRSVVRKQVDPETTKYFSEIANLIESNGVDMEERSVVCGNALEEARGKEFELATDYYLSHTMQTLLEGCDVNSLCSFLRSCAKDFPSIAMDRSGSHVAETAIKSLSQHLQDNDVYSVIEDTLNAICKVIVKNPGDLMCDCYGSHVLRSLLSLFKGVPLDSSEFNRRKSSSVLAERLNFKAFRADTDISPQAVQGFPGLLDFLVSGMSKCIQNNIKTMQVDQYSSLVLQSALKLLAGDEEKLLQIIPILIGCTREEILEGDSIKTTKARNILYLMKETAFSHLMEVALEVAPEVLYNEMFTKVFRNSLFELSSHHCGNFVIQALISHAGSQDQMEVIWEELGSKFKDLLKMGKSGIIASLIAASQRLHIYEHKCCEALATAVHSSNESSTCIVPRILFLDSYFYCEDKSNWNWPSGAKMHVMGSLILQGVFRFQNEFIQPFITSITSLNADNILEAAKDSGGARVIEAFLSSDASAKLKRRLIMKLRGHFGELSLQSSGSFTVEKCFTVGNISLREAIVSELLTVQSELWNTKQGPHLMRKLDVDGFAARPDQWRSRQESKQSTFNEFYSTFGSSETKPSKNSSFLSDDSKKTSQPNKIKQMREEIAHLQTSPAPFLSTTGFKRKPNKPEKSSKRFARNSADEDVPKVKKNKSKNIVTDEGTSQSMDKAEKKRHREDVLQKSPKKLKT
ncbi:PREDICTED: nucleolar 9 [Prunus dulcis]|uniref:PREDICTED: nucleolar 9 n=2 Tax=Prunus dulcis TaxID=3755 RepID=A0A5E4F1W5_PRUDU|nr:pumilio homolog 23 isoform X1 [Prunus dulcis]VVA20641.1 PREDICTED: nucleolar 9 [Prunus dulcis]